MADYNLKTINILTLILLVTPMSLTKDGSKSRQKRILWVTQDGRLALPPGTTLVISPSLSLPFVRYPPEGFFSNLTISLPFTIDFNKLGLTDNENPYGVLPPLLARSMGRAAGTILADYIGGMLRRRGKRSTEKDAKPMPHAFHGGERALLYVMLEDLLDQFGMDGRACLLRAICEVHAHPMTNFGLVGEMLKLFFSASKSPYANMLTEYVEAEYAGTGQYGGPAECWPYMKDCPKSLFLPKHNLYNDEDNEIPHEDPDDLLKPSKVTYNPSVRNM
ncbi:uncharacterized protein LOC130901511 [Diorhabda carinulata]|uniref:uncharacterized protein LOC130901511 n=1 Tax=Diorhabda carinulata TaxID=1163345 RepID=UPI0025A0BEED|nr:uncharacterized protein LOC130901511 [Diorhabda carinulata]XP_057668940.1 uncharacterized protein LOC130901511 [Diorhabda carinulata]